MSGGGASVVCWASQRRKGVATVYTVWAPSTVLTLRQRYHFVVPRPTTTPLHANRADARRIKLPGVLMPEQVALGVARGFIGVESSDPTVNTSGAAAYAPLVGDVAEMNEDDQMELLRQRVFEHLWEEGFYVGAGSKFGGHYLVYTSDPSAHVDFEARAAASVARDAQLIQNIRRRERVAQATAGVLPFGLPYGVMQRALCHASFSSKVPTRKVKKKKKKFKRKKRKRGDAAPGAIGSGEVQTVKRLRQLDARELEAMQLRKGISASTAAAAGPIGSSTRISASASASNNAGSGAGDGGISSPSSSGGAVAATAATVTAAATAKAKAEDLGYDGEHSHAEAIVLVVLKEHHHLGFHDISGYSRLGIATKKVVILASTVDGEGAEGALEFRRIDYAKVRLPPSGELPPGQPPYESSASAGHGSVAHLLDAARALQAHE